MEEFINLTVENIEKEHVCCAIGDKKHQEGVNIKKDWLRERFTEGHVFRRLDAKGKVFIEYAPLEKAWVPITGDNYLYIYCFWVSGSFKGKGYGKALIEYCIKDAKERGKSGICVMAGDKKKPFLSDKKFLEHYGFETVDRIGDGYELMAYSFDGTKPSFTESARNQSIDDSTLTIYYGVQCPYVANSIREVTAYCEDNGIPLHTEKIDTLEKAKAAPCIFQNWAVFYQGKFQNMILMNEGSLKKMLGVK